MMKSELHIVVIGIGSDFHDRSSVEYNRLIIIGCARFHPSSTYKLFLTVSYISDIFWYCFGEKLLPFISIIIDAKFWD